MFHVPKAGQHKLKLEAIKSTVMDAVRRTGKATPFQSESFPLVPDKDYEIKFLLADSRRKIKVTLTGHEDVLVDCPLGRMRENPNGIALQRQELSVVSPNQYLASRSDTKHVRSLANIAFQSELVGLKTNSEVMLLRLSIESDGPLISRPDDLAVARKLLKDFEAGTPTSFEFNPDGWYEFERE